MSKLRSLMESGEWLPGCVFVGTYQARGWRGSDRNKQAHSHTRIFHRRKFGKDYS